MNIGIVTLFPEMFTALNYGITGRAINTQLLTLQHFNPRDFTEDSHRTVDDHPYGGGPGMLMKCDPLRKAIQTAKKTLGSKSTVIYVSPQGRQFDQKNALAMTQRSSMIFVAGRYKGIDERIIQTEIDEEWSLGDYILSGGELAVMVMIDAITRLLPGALGDAASAEKDSFMQSLLDYPHFTRPDIIHGLSVPEVLLSGDHQKIARWRLKHALGQTWLKRPNLLENRSLSDVEQSVLTEFINEYQRTSKNE